jgi:thioester reductase-like protein
LFDNLRRDQPDFTQKVHAVNGDIVEEGLGLQDDQRAFLEENIHVVFHSAATVKFDEPLRLVVNSDC